MFTRFFGPMMEADTEAKGPPPSDPSPETPEAPETPEQETPETPEPEPEATGTPDPQPWENLEAKLDRILEALGGDDLPDGSELQTPAAAAVEVTPNEEVEELPAGEESAMPEPVENPENPEGTPQTKPARRRMFGRRR